MTTAAELGFATPTGDELVNTGDNAITQNANASAEMYDALKADATTKTNAAESRAKVYADAGDVTTINAAKAYTDTEAEQAKNDAIAVAAAQVEALGEITPRKYEATQDDLVGGIVDRNKHATWLTHDQNGGPTDYARESLGVQKIKSGRLAGGFLDTDRRETELVFDEAGRVPDRVLNVWSSRLTPPADSTRSVWGHSLAAGIAGGASPWTPMLANLLGVPVYNFGVGGASSLHVGARQGGKPALVSVDGGTIPTSGPVNIFIDVDYMFGGVSGNQPVTIRGVSGTMTKVADNGEGADCTFTRSTPGTAVTVPDGSPVLTQYGDLARADVTYIWAARNDFFKAGASPELAVRNISRMVDYLTSVHKKVLILEEPPAESETIGTANREEVDAYNAAIRTAFPQYWVPVMAWLRTQEAADAAGITFTAQDQTDITNGITPASFRVDTLHLSTVGNTAIAHRLHTEEINRGWI